MLPCFCINKRIFHAFIQHQNFKPLKNLLDKFYIKHWRHKMRSSHKRILSKFHHIFIIIMRAVVVVANVFNNFLEQTSKSKNVKCIKGRKTITYTPKYMYAVNGRELSMSPSFFLPTQSIFFNNKLRQVV